MSHEKCPTCGSPVKIWSGKNGTNSYEPIIGVECRRYYIQNCTIKEGERICIINKSGEGGTFSLDGFEKIVHEFFIKNL